MAALFNSVVKVGKKLILPEYKRAISLSATAQIKEIVERKEGNTLIIEGKILPQKNEAYLVKPVSNGACILCSTGLDVKHTDVLILKQFLRSDGCMLPRRITGLCKVQQKRITTLVAMAQKAGLMNHIEGRKDPRERRLWKKFNTYYDESTIKVKYF